LVLLFHLVLIAP
jgi:diphthamide biosynthesis protein 2